MATLRYGDESLAQWPTNVSQLIVAEAGQDLVVSQRNGGMNLTQSGTPFTIDIVAGVPVLINPLLPTPVAAGVLWITDGNNRATPNYAAAIPGLTIPVGYKKFVDFTFTFAIDKIGQGEDTYLFQLEVDGTPEGIGIEITMGTLPQVITLIASTLVPLDTTSALGLAVTGLGTGDDLEFESFEMGIVDFQPWTDPDA